MKNKAAFQSTVEQAMETVIEQFPVRLTDNVRNSMRHDDDPVARQYLPDLRELGVTREERTDPIGDSIHSPVKGIVHRHPDRVLFKAASVCAVNCRFCFRKNMLGTPEETLNAAETEKALRYIQNHDEIREVILTGGDPLILSQRQLENIIKRLNDMDHVKIIRIHSRVPVVDPEPITESFCKIFAYAKPVYLILHINHVQEITDEVEKCLMRLHQYGVSMLSQSVLLKDINDNVETLSDLFLKLLTLKIKPYYLHHPDLVQGTKHFRISIEKGQALVKALRTRITGIAMPTYVLDIPGGYGKIPLENACIEQNGSVYTVTDHQGREHKYP